MSVPPSLLCGAVCLMGPILFVPGRIVASRFSLISSSGIIANCHGHAAVIVKVAGLSTQAESRQESNTKRINRSLLQYWSSPETR